LDSQGHELTTKRLQGTGYLGKEILVGSYSIATDSDPNSLSKKTGRIV